MLFPRQEAIENGRLDTDSDALDIDFVDYVKFSESECYLEEDFEKSFTYPLYGLVFVPENQVYFTGFVQINWHPFHVWRCWCGLRLLKNYVRGTCRDFFFWKRDNDKSFVFRLKISKDSLSGYEFPTQQMLTCLSQSSLIGSGSLQVRIKENYICLQVNGSNSSMLISHWRMKFVRWTTKSSIVIITSTVNGFLRGYEMTALIQVEAKLFKVGCVTRNNI